MHTLIIANRDGSRTSLNYDANRHLLDENGQLLPQFCEQECPEEKQRKKPGISLRIAMGKKCNFNCAYCHQSPFRESELKRGVPKAKKDKLDAFVQGLDKVCSMYGDIGYVQFWGGEPLVYFEEIKILQEGMTPPPKTIPLKS